MIKKIWWVVFVAWMVVLFQYYRFVKFISNPKFINSGVLVDNMYFPFDGTYIVDTKGVYSRLK